MKANAAAPSPFPMPGKDDADFAALPGEVRRDVRLWATRFARVWNVRPITGAIRQLARVCDRSYSTVLRKYYALRSSGDWRTLIDRAQVPTCPLTVRLPIPVDGVRVCILAHTQRECLLQIQRVPEALSAVPRDGKGGRS